VLGEIFFLSSISKSVRVCRVRPYSYIEKVAAFAAFLRRQLGTE
jgi:hypothetical protein